MIDKKVSNDLPLIEGFAKKIVYIAHPISGNVVENIASIFEIVKEMNLNNPEVIPFAHYLIDCLAMDDDIPEERARGIKNDTEFFNRKFIDELWLYGDKISNGMKAEIELAMKINIPIRPMTEGTIKDFFDIPKSV